MEHIQFNNLYISQFSQTTMNKVFIMLFELKNEKERFSKHDLIVTFFFTRLHKYLIDQSYGYNVDHEIFKSYISVILQEF